MPVVCQPGSYCPAGASLQQPCPPGRYGAVEGLSSCESTCPVGHYCPGGTAVPLACQSSQKCLAGTSNPLSRAGSTTWQAPTFGSVGSLLVVSVLAVWLCIVPALSRRANVKAMSLNVKDILLDQGEGAVLGRGGQGTVRKGRYHGAQVAIKTLLAMRMTESSSVSSVRRLWCCGRWPGGFSKYAASSTSQEDLKVVRPAQVAQDKALTAALAAALAQEAAALVKLQHPNVVRVYGFCTGLNIMVVMECCQLGSLSQAIQARRVGQVELTDNVRRDIALGIATGMRFIHENGFVHMDLKPGNVLLALDGDTVVPKVSDMGLAARLPKARKVDLTCGGNAPAAARAPFVQCRPRGTLQFMAPEMLVRQSNNLVNVTQKADVFSFGILLIELYMGCLMYEGRRPHGASRRDLKRSVRQLILSGAVPDIPVGPQAIRELITVCVSRDPSLRPDFAAIVKTLSNTLVDGSAPLDPSVQDIQESLVDEYDATESPRPEGSSSVHHSSFGGSSLGRQGRAPLLAVPLPIRGPTAQHHLHQHRSHETEQGSDVLPSMFLNSHGPFAGGRRSQASPRGSAPQGLSARGDKDCDGYTGVPGAALWATSDATGTSTEPSDLWRDVERGPNAPLELCAPMCSAVMDGTVVALPHDLPGPPTKGTWMGGSPGSTSSGLLSPLSTSLGSPSSEGHRSSDSASLPPVATTVGLLPSPKHYLAPYAGARGSSTVTSHGQPPAGGGTPPRPSTIRQDRVVPMDTVVLCMASPGARAVDLQDLHSDDVVV